jgi:hypothetical protein
MTGKDEKKLKFWQMTVPMVKLSLRGRVLSMSILSMFNAALWFFMLSDLRYSSDDAFFGSVPGWVMLSLSVLMILIMAVAAKKVKKVGTAYGLIFLGGAPGLLAFFDAGLRLSLAWLGWSSTVWMSLGMTAALFATPMLISSSYRRIQEDLQADKKQMRLLKEKAVWDASKDYEKAEEFNRNPPLLARILLMIAPALGLNFSDIVGVDLTIVVIALIGFFVPYIALFLGFTTALSRVRLFRELEQQIGRPILIAEEE